MKKLLFITLFFLISIVAISQNNIPYLICNDGLLLNKYIRKNYSVNTIIDTISLQCAKNIFAIGGIGYKNQQFENLIITDYTLTIISNDGNLIKIDGHESKFNTEMIIALKGIKPNSKIHLEGILCTTDEGFEKKSKFHLLLMSFFVK